MGKIVITGFNDRKILFLFNDEHELTYIKCINGSIVGNIYVGLVDKINKSLQCAFVNIGKGKSVFLPLSDCVGTIKGQDNILIQISADPIKTKLPQGTMKLTLAGEYCVCHLIGQGINISKKLPEHEATELIEILRKQDRIDLSEYKWMIRTNSASLLKEDDLTPLYEEIEGFIEKGNFLRDTALTRKIYTKVYEETPGAGSAIRDIPSEYYDDIITDDKDIFDTLSELDICKRKNLRFFDNTGVSLKNLYSLETHIGRILDPKVYLNCGGYIVIEQTEAMNVIDVNSGRADNRKKDSDKYIRRINIEAAHEIARQIRLRNLSGIIMVDFINMKDKESSDELIEVFKEALSKDKVPTHFVDITALGIAELTRKKVNLSFKEELSDKR